MALWSYKAKKKNRSKAFPDILKIEITCQTLPCAQQRTIGKNSKGCLENKVHWRYRCIRFVFWVRFPPPFVCNILRTLLKLKSVD